MFLVVTGNTLFGQQPQMLWVDLGCSGLFGVGSGLARGLISRFSVKDYEVDQGPLLTRTPTFVDYNSQNSRTPTFDTVFLDHFFCIRYQFFFKCRKKGRTILIKIHMI